MKFYFTPAQAPEMAGLTRAQRKAVLRCALEAFFGEDPSRVWSAAPWLLGGLLGGALADFQVRAWDAGVLVNSYEEAVVLCNTRNLYLGVSEVLQNVTLGNYTPPGGTPTPPAALAGLKGFTMAWTIPEPSTYALAIFGAMAGMWIFQRRK